MPVATAIRETAQRAARAHQAEQHAGQRRAAGFGGVSGQPDLE